MAPVRQRGARRPVSFHSDVVGWRGINRGSVVRKVSVKAPCRRRRRGDDDADDGLLQSSTQVSNI